jgi:D-arabinose 1-dehydrogenase-like Zn-dependent alcohol dehydrogenase
MHSRQTHLTPHVTGDPKGRSADIRLMPGVTLTAWQAILSTALAPHDRVLVLGGDGAARHWADLAQCAGLRVEILAQLTPKAVARRIGQDRYGMLKAVLVVAGDMPPRNVRAALDASFHDALLFVDASGTPAADLAGAHADIVLTDPRTGLARLGAL